MGRKKEVFGTRKKRRRKKKPPFTVQNRSMHPLPDARRFLNCIFMLARISKLRKKDERRGPRKMERREESSLLSPRLEKKPLPALPVLVH